MTGGIWDRAATEYESTGVDFFAPLGRDLVTHVGDTAAPSSGRRDRLRRQAGLGANAPDAFDDPAALAAMVHSAGFTDVVVDDVAVPVRFRDVDQWWAWSVGYRIRFTTATTGRAA